MEHKQNKTKGKVGEGGGGRGGGDLFIINISKMCKKLML
jgi:hypothetical protein